MDLNITQRDCGRCGKTKAVNEFYKRNRSKTYRYKAGYDCYCKICRRELIAKVREAQGGGYTDYQRNWDYQKKFGITLLEYKEILANQNNCCAICGKNESELTMKLAVDHDHTTNKVRGLLCANCNRGLGYFKEDLSITTGAIDYVCRTKGYPAPIDFSRFVEPKT